MCVCVCVRACVCACARGKHGRALVLGKEIFLGYTEMNPERVSVGKEGESHSM